MTSKVTVQTESNHAEAETEIYAFAWRQIKQLAPAAVLLRGPEAMNPVQVSGSTDIDVLVPANIGLVKTFLKNQGFCRVLKPHGYLERFRLQMVGNHEPYTIDLYRAERWGAGFRSPVSQGLVDVRRSCLLHAILDRKGTKYFEQKVGGPPWCGSRIPGLKFGPLGRALWRTGNTGLLTLYLLTKGVITPDSRMILQTQFRKIVYRVWQLVRKTGLEVALLGVDGTGKSSVAASLRNLPAPVKVIYMGPHDYQTRIMKFVNLHKMPLFMWQLAFRYDLLVRRIYGWLFARRGWIVIYDRHPVERLDLRQRSLRNRVKNFLDCLYAWPVDLTFWLTGNYSVIYKRKKEYMPEELQAIDRQFQAILAYYRIPFERVDVTENSLDSVGSSIAQIILAKHQERSSIANLPRLLRAVLV